MSSRRIFICLSTAGLSLTGALQAAAPSKLCGHIYDPTSQPIAGASVALYGRDSNVQLNTVASNSGEYCFSALPQGQFLLQARNGSLVLTKAERVSISATSTALPDLTLSIAPVSQQVTVTAAGLAQTPSETAKEINVIDAPAAAERGEDSLVDALKELPGFRVVQTGGPGSFSTVQIRGLRSFDTSVLIDGMRFRDVSATQADASSFLADLWFTDTNRVEVLQGAGASLYGTNAIGGVINMVTDQGGGPFHGDVDLQGGMLGQFLGRAHLAGGALHQRLSYSLGFGHENVTEGVDGDDRYRNTGGLAAIDYALTSKIRVGARVLGSDVFGQLNNTPMGVPMTSLSPMDAPVNAVPLPASQIPAALAYGPYVNGNATFIPDVDDPDSYRAVQFISTMLYWEHSVAPTFSYRATYQAFDTKRNYVNGPAGLGYQPLDRTSDRYNGGIDTARVSADWTPLHSQVITGGYEFEREHFDNPSYIGQIPSLQSSTTVTQTSNTAFVQDQARLLQDRLQISLSGRWQGFTLDAPAFTGAVLPVYASASAITPPNAFTGDASAAYFVRSSNTKIRTHIGNAYRAPSLYERFGTYFYGNSFTAYGDPRLAPERAISVDGGIDQYFASDKVKISATYFYTRLQETIGFDETGAVVNPRTDPFGRLFGGYYNTPGGLARGVEVSTEAKLPHGVLVRAAYTYTNSIDKISQYPDGDLRTPVILPQTFSFFVGKQFGKRWDASVDGLISSSYLYPFYGLPPNVFTGPRQVNVSLGYTVPINDKQRVRIYSRVENLNNQTLYEQGFITPGIVARGGVQFWF